MDVSVIMYAFHSSMSTFLRSKDEDINLVSVEEFYEEAPKDISKPVRCALRNSYCCVHTARHRVRHRDPDQHRY